MRNIGLFGGTFDPIHYGHIEVAKAAQDCAGLDEVWLLPAKTPPHKPGVMTPAADRLAMVRLAIQGIPGLKASDIELRLPDPSYTFNTIQAIKKAYPNNKFHLIIGLDEALLLSTWHRWHELLTKVPVWVSPRPGYVFDEAALRQLDRYELNPITLKPHQASSTELRELLSKGKTNDYLPESVENYIKKHSLYLGRRSVEII